MSPPLGNISTRERFEVSTDISTRTVALSGGRNSSLAGVNTRRQHIEDLADYVQRVRREKGLSQRDVEVRSGSAISKGYIGQIENRAVLGQSVTPHKLQALAVGLSVSEDEIFAVVRGKSLTDNEVFDSEIYLMLRGYDELADKDKIELLPTVRMLATEIRRRKPKGPKPPKKAPAPERLPIIDTRVTPVGGHPAAEVVPLAKQGRKK